ncbi:hypothetical protein DIT72_02415 [Marinobacter orientalis]|nr:hypothetical protein DIT72_02415 [Marinobacter orientalis]
MRRVLAFWVDMVFVAIIAAIVTFSLAITLDVNIPSYFFYFLFVPLIFSIIEIFFKGVTAGRYFFGLRLVDFDLKPVDSFVIMARCFFLFLFIPVLALIFAFFYRFFWGESQIRFEFYLAGLIFLILNISVFLFSLGKQVFADLLFSTAVISKRKKSFDPYSWRAAFYSFVFVVLVSIAVFIYVDNDDSLIYTNSFSRSIPSMHESASIFSVDVADLDTSKNDFYEFYDGWHGFTGHKSISKIQDKLGFWFNNGEKLPVPDIMIPSNVVRVSFSGVFNGFFMDSLSRNLFLRQHEKTGTPGSLVGFLYFEQFFGIFSLKIYTWRLAGLNPYEAEPDPTVMVFSPEANYRIAPFFLIGVTSERTFSELETMSINEVNDLR